MSAEPMRAAQSDDGDRLIEFAEQILGVPLDPWQMRLCRRVFGGNVGRSTGRPDAEQPTPAAVITGGIGYPVREAARREHEEAQQRAAAAPPRIEDMAPGTRFCNNSAGHSTHTWFPAPFDSSFGDLHYTCPGRIDPSTIRDVIPPAVTP